MITSLDKNTDYSKMIIKGLHKIINVAKPDLNEPVFHLSPKESTETSQKFNAKCVFCPDKFLIVSVYVSNGYLRYE